MKDKIWEVNVKVPGAGTIKTQVSAQTSYYAQKIVESLYGKGSLVGLPQEKK